MVIFEFKATPKKQP